MFFVSANLVESIEFFESFTKDLLQKLNREGLICVVVSKISIKLTSESFERARFIRQVIGISCMPWKQ